MSDKGNSKEETKEPTKYRRNEDRHIDNVTRHRITVEDRKIDRDRERKKDQTDRRTTDRHTDGQINRKDMDQLGCSIRSTNGVRMT